jgi:hypothetical protein
MTDAAICRLIADSKCHAVPCQALTWRFAGQRSGDGNQAVNTTSGSALPRGRSPSGVPVRYGFRLWHRCCRIVRASMGDAFGRANLEQEAQTELDKVER